MKNRYSIFIAPAMMLCTAGVVAQAVPTTPRHYDAVARHTLSANDVKSFVHQWFAWFDHQADIKLFLKHLDKKNIDMLYPDFPIRSEKDFRRWYGGVVENVQWNSHDVRNLTVSGSAAEGFNVGLDVCWNARFYDGKTAQMLVHQDWKLKPNAARQLVFEQMRATATGACQ
jgi:hypothetical protein